MSDQKPATTFTADDRETLMKRLREITDSRPVRTGFYEMLLGMANMELTGAQVVGNMFEAAQAFEDARSQETNRYAWRDFFAKRARQFVVAIIPREQVLVDAITELEVRLKNYQPAPRTRIS